MRKFSKVFENNNKKYFKINANVTLVVKCDNEGEAGYIADSIIGGIEEQSDFIINDIEEVDKLEIDKEFESIKNNN